MVESARIKLGCVREQANDPFFEEEAFTFTTAGSFIPLYYTKAKHSLNPLTRYGKSPVHNAWGECGEAPAPLAPFQGADGVMVYPMDKALEPYSSPVLVQNPAEVADAMYTAMQPFRHATRGLQRRVFEFEEAIAGLPGDDCFNGLPRSTSPGYPYVMRGIRDKKRFFGAEGPYTWDSDLCKVLRDSVLECLQLAANGVRMTHVYVDFLKDELRSFEKVAAGKTRLISSSPLLLTVCLRMMFGCWTAAMQRTRIENGCAVGINPKTEWDFLARMLMQGGECCGSGDYKAFDSSEQPVMQEAIVHAINDWYDDGPVNARIREVLWMEFYHSRHLTFDFSVMRPIVVQWNKANPSGFALTTYANNAYNLCAFNVCWNRLLPEKKGGFWKEAYVVVYGDDNALNPGRVNAETFSQDKIAAEMLTIGLTYTPSDKGTVFKGYGSIEEIDFIKRGFRFDERLCKWVGPLDINSVLHAPYWYKNHRLRNEILRDNVEFMLQELSLHAPEEWDRVPRIVRKLRQLAEVEPLLRPDRSVYQDSYDRGPINFGAN
jgi:hypothetical protein